MIIVFTVRHEFGYDRYYASDTVSNTLVYLSGRKCLRDVDIERLRIAGFIIKLNYETKQWSTPDERIK